LALYRPGTGTTWILKNVGGAFSAVYAQGDPRRGIGGYDLGAPADRAFGFDYIGSGKPSYLTFYRPAYWHNMDSEKALTLAPTGFVNLTQGERHNDAQPN
jgi:hypothetical protein